MIAFSELKRLRHKLTQWRADLPLTDEEQRAFILSRRVQDLLQVLMQQGFSADEVRAGIMVTSQRRPGDELAASLAEVAGQPRGEADPAAAEQFARQLEALMEKIS